MDQEASNSLEINEHVVEAGSKVRVRWLGNWYEGEIEGISPQKDLYQVVESQSGLPVILHISQMKSIDKSRSAHQRFTVGAEVGYYDNSLAEWLGGTIQASNTPASVIVKWKREDGLNENFNWFDEKDIAPIVENEASGADDHHLQQSMAKLPEINSSLSLQDILEEKPVYRMNEAFESPDMGKNPLEDHLPDIEQVVEDFQQQKRLGKRRTSISMKDFYAKKCQKISTSNKRKNGDLNDYLENQHALLHGKLDHSALPAIWSYLHSSAGKGIPHHPASRFFFFHSSKMKRAQSSMFASHLPRSPTMISHPESEPMTYAGFSFKKNPLMISGGHDRKMKKQATNMSLRPLPPLPGEDYEVPISIQPSGINQTPQRRLHKGGSSGEIYDKIKDTNSTSGSRTQLKNQTPNQGIIIKSTSPRKQMVSAGGSVTLFCEVESPTPVTYEWFKDGTRLTHNDEQVAFPEPGKLQLYGLNLRNAGRYQCHVTNSVGISEGFECILRVEEDTLKRSFSRGFGLYKLALGDQQLPEETAVTEGEENKHSTVSLPNLDDQGVSTSQIPKYELHPFSFLKSPSSMDLTRELLDKDVQRLEAARISEQEQNPGKDKSPLIRSSGTSIGERKTHKEKRKRTSNVILGEMDNYLEGYGEDYGQASHVLDAPGDSGKKQKKKKAMKGRNKEKKKTSKASSMGDGDDSKMKKRSKKSKKTSDSNLENENKPLKVFAEVEMEEVDSTAAKHVHYEIPEIEIEEITMPIPPEEEFMQSDEGGEEEVDPPVPYPLQLDSLLTDPAFDRDVVGEEKSHENTSPGESQLPKHTVFSRSNESIDVRPEYDSLTSISSDSEQGALRDDKMGSSNVDLPLQVEHYTEGIKRLQISAQEYEDDHFGKDESSKSQGLLNKLFRSNKTDSQEN